MTFASDEIETVGKKFHEILLDYRKKRLRNSALDESFMDSDENIFIDKENHKFLIDLINEDRRINCSNDELVSYLESINKKISDHLDSLGRRRYQAEKALKVLRSETHYLTDCRNRLWLSMGLTEECVKRLDMIEKSLSDKTDTEYIKTDTEYILFLINKCTVLSRIPYLQKDFLETLCVLNDEVQKRSGYILNDSLYFRLGTLNFSAHNYSEARVQLQLAVSKLEARDGSLTDSEIEMLFYAYLEIVMSYEFCGKYKEALAYLISASINIGATDICQKYIDIFKQYLDNYAIETLNFQAGNEAQQTRIIDTLSNILSRDKVIFPGRMASFAVKHKKTFSRRVEEFNNNMTDLVASLETVDDTTRKKVTSHWIREVEPNQALHDYLHLVAHCLNELGVDLLKSFETDLKDSQEELAHKTIILARALMLFVSEDKNFYSQCHRYKSCFATGFAEAGDFDIANHELSKIVNDRERSSLDVVSKAELDFFTYRIHRMSRITSGVLDYIEDLTDTQYNHYLNLCYRLFDYDAIAHMALISFEYYLSTILHADDLENVASYFSRDTPEEEEFSIRYFTFGTEAVGDSHNNWLTSECEKVQYFVEFLRSFFQSDGASYTRDLNIYDVASRCLHYCDLGKNRDEDQVRFVSFTSAQDVLDTLREILPVYKYHDDDDSTELAIGNCSYYLIKTNTGFEKLRTSLKESNNMFFIHSKITISISSLPYDDQPRIRSFDNELGALQEFFLFCTFMQIRADFTDPKSIFVLTPINNEGLCDYQVANFDTLLGTVSETQSSSIHHKNKVNDQYRITVAGHAALSTAWLVRLKPYEGYIKWAVSFLVDTDDPRTNIRYFLGLPGKETLSAVMFRQTKCLKKLEVLFKPPVKTGNCTVTSECRKLCKICAVDYEAIDSDFLLSFAELPSKAEIPEINEGKLLIWMESKDAYICWRLVFVVPVNHFLPEETIRLALCNSGDDDIFERVPARVVVDWPEPSDPNNGNFLFICHSGKDDNLVKTELLDFFVANKVRFWYDSTKIIDEQTWVDRIRDVIRKKNCVGCVVLVTNHEFFSSPAIRAEFEILASKKKESKGQFKVMPVFYNLGSVQDIENLIKSSFGYGDTKQNAAQKICQDLIIPSHDHVSIFLNDWEGSSLSKYSGAEKTQGRQVSLIQAFRGLYVISDEVNITLDQE